jgi:hypothetical protein
MTTDKLREWVLITLIICTLLGFIIKTSLSYQ